jgi:hypothetical protein
MKSMAYKYSKIDNENIGWFTKDMTKCTLLGVELVKGMLRGLTPVKVDFQYPVTVIAGKNCSGKSTLLALVSCAFHNDNKEYKLPNKKTNYYTFSDFFIQTQDEVPPQGLEIKYKILYDKWRPSKSKPDGKGIGIQIRKKKTGGKWNDYSKRVDRNVVFLGIDRVVPYSEKTVYISYKSYFKKKGSLGWEDKVKDTVGKILGKTYDDFWFISHGKYRIPVVKIGDLVYSGFNMGAGENTLFQVFSIIYGCPKGVLIVIDEIELGLHEQALIGFIKILKEICKEQKCQIIATTHSQSVLRNTPPIGRLFLENIKGQTIITDSITALYAAGKLAGENSNELDIFVEDGTAKKILELALSTETRNRVNIIAIGSASAIARQLAARFKNVKEGACLAILDGDKRNSFAETKTIFLNSLETVKMDQDLENWLNQRVEYLPGDSWPEIWILNEIKQSDCIFLCSLLKIEKDILLEYIEESLLSGKHNEFYTLSTKVNLEKDLVISSCAKEVIDLCKSSFEVLEKFIIDRLEKS